VVPKVTQAAELVKQARDGRLIQFGREKLNGAGAVICEIFGKIDFAAGPHADLSSNLVAA
jgi:hypothetical protein